MQGISVAISPAGLEFFAKSLASPAGGLAQTLSSMRPVDHTINPPAFQGIFPNNHHAAFSVITIQLSHGNVSNLTPIYEGLTSQGNGAFQLTLSSSTFNANYSWLESYTQQNLKWWVGERGQGFWVDDGTPFPVKNTFSFSAGIASLQTTFNFSFAFDPTHNVWTLPLTNTAASASGPVANIPDGSILLTQSADSICVKNNLDQATTNSIDDFDFKSAVQNAVVGYLASIPASGQLAPDITFAFGLGDSPLTFPNNQGLTVGVTGISTYKGQTYSGTPPTNLPVPAVPTDGHHLQMYVSDYTLNGLYWAFANAGLLTETVTPTMLQQMGLDPSVLDVSTYYSAIPSSDPVKQALAPYRERVMYAKVSPALDSNNLPISPTVNFQTVYVFDGPQGSVMKSLQNPKVLSSTDYNNLETSSIPSNAYANAQDLKSDLNAISITDSQSIQVIEAAAQGLGTVVTHALELTCAIQGATLPNGDAPFFTFTLTRQDILTNLVLGVSKSGKAQTLQFTHVECQPSPSLNTPAEQAQFSNFIPLKSAMWFTSIWATVGEQQYSTLLVNLGQHGVPLPIMQGFQFVFENALTNLEQGYVGILANVEFTS